MGLIRCRSCGDVVSTLVDRCPGCGSGMPRGTGWLRLPRAGTRRGMSRITRATLLALAAVLLCDLVATALDARRLRTTGPLAVAGPQSAGLSGAPDGGVRVDQVLVPSAPEPRSR